AFRRQRKGDTHGPTPTVSAARPAGALGPRLAAIPPPLTPPHKGEWDLGALCRKGSQLTCDRLRQSPPPPCGEGLGVGVSAAEKFIPPPLATLPPGRARRKNRRRGSAFSRRAASAGGRSG